MTDNKVFNEAEKRKLKEIIGEGMGVLQEIETLNGGLRDTIKAVAEEMEIKPSILRKAIRVAHKANFAEETVNYDLLENILITTGKVD